MFKDEKVENSETTLTLSSQDSKIDTSTVFTREAEKEKSPQTNYQIPWKIKLQLFWSFKHPKDYYIKKKFFFWTPPDQSKYETKLIFKLDCFILSYACVACFIRFLAASSVSTAYVSGMQEDLNMSGTDYNWLMKGFGISYGIFGFPLTILVSKFRPHIILPLIEFIWGIMVLLTIACNTYKGLLILRVFEGAIEGACFPILHYILGSWYNKHELSVRTGIFLGSAPLGKMFGGYIQSGVYKSLNNKGGLPGWKWIFVIDFIITAFVATTGFFLIPDTPHQAKPSIILSEEDIEYCKNRIKITKNIKENHSNNWNIFIRLISSWQFYVFGIFYTLSNLPSYASGFWSIVLKAQGYSVYQRNNYPTIQYCIELISSVFFGIYVDIRGSKWDGLMIVHVIWIIGIALLVKWDIPRYAEFIAYCLCGISNAVTSIIFSWANEMTREDTQLRAALLGSMNLINIGPNTAFEIICFNTDYAPSFKTGTRISLGLAIASFLTIFITVWFDRYQRRKRDYIDNQIEEKVNL